MRRIELVWLAGLLFVATAGAQEAGDGPAGNLVPTVQVDRNSPNKSRVGVHVPIFFDMSNDKDDQLGRSKLDLSVLNGLVTVNRDRERKENGLSAGPLTVTVFGIPVYTGNVLKQYDSSTRDQVQAQSRSLKSAVADQAAANEQLLSTIRKNSDRMTQYFGDMLARMSNIVRPQGEPIDYSSSEKRRQQPTVSSAQPQVQPEQPRLGDRYTRSDSARAMADKDEPLHENLDQHV